MSGAHCMVNDNFCGETETLKIIKEFQKLYEDKFKKIDELENVDASELKIQMLQEWVRDITDQNTMLVEAVEDLEREASDRVTLLEEKLQSSQAVYKALSSSCRPQEFSKIDDVKNKSETIQVKNLEADVKNLLEVIRRIRDEGIWSIKELTFHTINGDDIIENKRSKALINTRTIENNQNKTKQDLQSLKDDLQQTKEHLNKKIAENIALTEQIAKMEKSAKETRDALTAEVADKHDSVRALRHEYQNLEEQCRQLDQQTHFKEDIIKEMRKELRAMRSKLNQENQCEVYMTDITLKNYSTNIWNQLKDASNNEIPSSTKELVTFLIQSEQNGVFDELKFGISATLSDIYKRDKQLIDYNSKVVTIQDNISTNLELLNSSQISLDTHKQSLEHIKNNQKTIEDRLSDIKTLLETLQAKKLNLYEKMSDDKNSFRETEMYNEKPVKENFLLNNLANEIKLIMESFECRSECICELEKLNDTIKTILVSTRDEFSIALKQSELYLKDNEMFQQKISINLENLNKLQSLFQFSDESQYISSDNFQENMQVKRSVSYQLDEYNNASERNSFVDTLLEKMKNHDKQIEELDSTISKLHKELNNSQTELAALEKRNSEERMNFEYGIKKSYETKVKVQQELIKQKDKKIEELIKILKGKADEKKEFEEKIKVLQSESSVAPTNSLIAQLVSELEEYREQLTESQSSIDEMRNKLEGKHQMLLNREDKIISLEKTMSSLNNMLIKSQNEIKQIKKKSTENLTNDVEQILSITQMGIKDFHTKVTKYCDSLQETVNNEFINFCNDVKQNTMSFDEKNVILVDNVLQKTADKKVKLKIFSDITKQSKTIDNNKEYMRNALKDEFISNSLLQKSSKKNKKISMSLKYNQTNVYSKKYLRLRKCNLSLEKALQKFNYDNLQLKKTVKNLLCIKRNLEQQIYLNDCIIQSKDMKSSDRGTKIVFFIMKLLKMNLSQKEIIYKLKESIYKYQKEVVTLKYQNENINSNEYFNKMKFEDKYMLLEKKLIDYDEQIKYLKYKLKDEKSNNKQLPEYLLNKLIVRSSQEINFTSDNYQVSASKSSKRRKIVDFYKMIQIQREVIKKFHKSSTKSECNNVLLKQQYNLFVDLENEYNYLLKLNNKINLLKTNLQFNKNNFKIQKLISNVQHRMIYLEEQLLKRANKLKEIITNLKMNNDKCKIMTKIEKAIYKYQFVFRNPTKKITSITEIFKNSVYHVDSNHYYGKMKKQPKNSNDTFNWSLLKKLNNILQKQRKTLRKYQNELVYLKHQNSEIANNGNKYEFLALNEQNSSTENEKLVQKLIELENTLLSKNAIIENLQQAVNLHQNTIQELEKQSADLQKLKEYQQQTITNLQEALVFVKHQLSELQNSNSSEVSTAWGWPNTSGLRARSTRHDVHDV